MNTTWKEIFRSTLILSVFFLFFIQTFSICADISLEGINLPEGFKISVYTSNVPAARQMALGKDNVVYVGTKDKDCVYAVIDRDGDNNADKVIKLIDGLHMPNGVAYQKGELYIAEVSKVIKIRNVDAAVASLSDTSTFQVTYEVVNDLFPNNDYHGWKYIKFGPDRRLYVPVGVPYNVGLSEDERFGTIMRMNSDGAFLEIIARGVRNSVGFDWQPGALKLWFTDNGRDLLGDNAPPDELNKLTEPGMNFGFPYVHGKEILDPQYGKGHTITEFASPEMELPAHVAALGMKFYTGSMFPAKYQNNIFIAEHGSWNRSTPIGYRISFVTVKGGKAVNYEIFADGWLKDGSVWGRPVDVLQMPDGAILISDDKAGVIYRISYEKPDLTSGTI